MPTWTTGARARAVRYLVGSTFDGSPALTEAHGAPTTDGLRARRTELKADVFRARSGRRAARRAAWPAWFTLISDDGSWLYVDGRLVIGTTAATGWWGRIYRVDLTAGPHRIRIEYGQDGGDVGLEAIYTPPDGQQRLLGPALRTEATVWGRPIRPAVALAIVSASSGWRSS